MTEIVLGVTGTRQQPTVRQLKFLYEYMLFLHEHGCRTLHHGCCTGWDEAAHYLAASLGWAIYMHRPENSEFVNTALYEGSIGYMLDPKPYAERNQNIVNAATHLIGGPLYHRDDTRSLRSGTWMTLRMAHRQRKPWRAVLPDGGTLYGEW